mgnify:CR=1 FL=1
MPGVEQAQEVINSLQAEISANPDAVLGQFGLATNNGRGYKVTDSSNPAFAAIGARPGDVLVSVNGRTLGDPQVDVKAKKMLRGLGYRDTDFDRKAREMSGGWIMRARLARLLVMEPDLLLLGIHLQARSIQTSAPAEWW